MKNSLKCIIGLSRPMGWKAYLWMAIIGYIDGAKSLTFNPLFAYTIVSYLAMAFAVNDLFDVDEAILSCKELSRLKGSCIFHHTKLKYLGCLEI